MSYVVGIPPEGTCNLFGPYSLLCSLNNDCTAGKRNKFTKGRFKKSVNFTWDHRLVDRLSKLDMSILHPQGKVVLLEVKEILAEHEASVARRIEENLGIDIIRGDVSTYTK